jgi:hypothetical protein
MTTPYIILSLLGDVERFSDELIETIADMRGMREEEKAYQVGEVLKEWLKNSKGGQN